jgi:hypothetical protein
VDPYYEKSHEDLEKGCRVLSETCFKANPQHFAPHSAATSQWEGTSTKKLQTGRPIQNALRFCFLGRHTCHFCPNNLMQSAESAVHITWRNRIQGHSLRHVPHAYWACIVCSWFYRFGEVYTGLAFLTHLSRGFKRFGEDLAVANPWWEPRLWTKIRFLNKVHE